MATDSKTRVLHRMLLTLALGLNSLAANSAQPCEVLEKIIAERPRSTSFSEKTVTVAGKSFVLRNKLADHVFQTTDGQFTVKFYQRAYQAVKGKEVRIPDNERWPLPLGELGLATYEYWVTRFYETLGVKVAEMPFFPEIVEFEGQPRVAVIKRYVHGLNDEEVERYFETYPERRVR